MNDLKNYHTDIQSSWFLDVFLIPQPVTLLKACHAHYTPH